MTFAGKIKVSFDILLTFISLICFWYLITDKESGRRPWTFLVASRVQACKKQKKRTTLITASGQDPLSFFPWIKNSFLSRSDSGWFVGTVQTAESCWKPADRPGRSAVTEGWRVSGFCCSRALFPTFSTFLLPQRSCFWLILSLNLKSALRKF